MSIYKTKQKEEILDIFNSNSDDVLTAFDIKNKSIDKGYNIGLTTIYRNVADLCDRGILKKTINSKGEAEYSLLTSECSSHFHLKCSKCGCIIHLSCDEVDHLYEHILKHHSFAIDFKNTVIYGICDNCK